MKKMTLLLLFVLVSVIGKSQSHEVSIPYFGYTYQVKGTILKAEKPNGTAVLIIAGSGPTDRNCNLPGMRSNAYKFLAEHLAKNGYSSLRYDKLGVGESVPGIPEKDMLFYDNVKVAHACYDFLAQQDGVDRIVVIGHSEGSLVGIILSKEVGAHKFISLAGTAFPANEILNTQFDAIPDEDMKTKAKGILKTLKEGGKVEVKDPNLLAIFRPSVQNYMISWFAYDPRVEISMLKMPVLVMQGDNDIQVANENADELAQANKKAKKVMIPNVTHVLKDGPRDREGNIASYSSQNVDIDDGVKKAILEFLEE